MPASIPSTAADFVTVARLFTSPLNAFNTYVSHHMYDIVMFVIIHSN